MTPIRVVITGATGNVGTSLVEALSRDGDVDSVLGIARRLPSWSVTKTSWARADVTRDDLVPHFHGADAVVHLAWIFQPTRDEAATWRNNVLGTIRVLEAVDRAGVPALVYASSIGAYSPGGSRPPVDEGWPTHALPTAAYGREKSYLERVLDDFEARHADVRVVRLRPAFTFKRESASQQRRLFAGPLLPNALVRPGVVPVMPHLPGLRFQAVHSVDAAEAYRLAILRPVAGPFNVAAEPILGTTDVARLLDARPVAVPRGLLRAAMALGWGLHLVPASPSLFDLFLSLPVMDSRRARDELGWMPVRSSVDAVREFLEGLRSGAGGPTPPLEARAGGVGRWRELATGVGRKQGV